MYSFDQRIAQMGTAKFRPRTGLREGMGLAVKDAVFRSWTAGKFHSMSELRDRNEQLMQLADQGFFSETVLDNAVPTRMGGMTLDDGLEDEVDFEYLASYANDHGKHFLTAEQIEQKVREETKERYDRKQEAYENASPGVRAAMTTTDIGMAMLDPVYAPTYFMGFPMMARSFQGIKMAMAGKAAGVATFEAGIESIAQTQAYKWNNEIGINYSVEQALTSIGMAAGISGILTLGADAAAIGIRKWLDKARKAKVDDSEEVKFYFETAEKVVDYLKGHGDDAKAIDILRETQQIVKRGSDQFTAGPTIPDSLSLKIYPGAETRAMPSGKVFEGTPSTWQIRLGREKEAAEAVAEGGVKKAGKEAGKEAPSIPDELLDQVIPVSTKGEDGAISFVDKSTREIVEESDEILGGAEALTECLRKAG